MITIRAARYGERAALLSLAVHFAQSPPYARMFETVEPWHIGQLIDRLFALGEEAAIFVAVEDDAVFGGLAIMDVPHLFTGEHYADELCWWVEPNRRGLRAGPQLLCRAEEWARARGLRTCKMVAPVPSDVGRFYEKMGYRALETAYVKVL